MIRRRVVRVTVKLRDKRQAEAMNLIAKVATYAEEFTTGDMSFYEFGRHIGVPAEKLLDTLADMLGTPPNDDEDEQPRRRARRPRQLT